MNIISINDLNFKYKDKIVFEKLNLKIRKGVITTVIGKNGSGKSTLLKLLLGLLPNKDSINYNRVMLNKENNKKIMKTVGAVSFNIIKNIDKTVIEQLNLVLEEKGISEKNIYLDKIIKKFELYEILNEKFINLNNNQKCIVCFALALVHEPKILLVDNLLSFVDPFLKDEILSLLLELKDGITIVYFTNNIEDTLISDDIVLIDDKKIVLKDDKESFYKEEKIINSCGYKLPFMVELSNRLKFYDLIDETIYDMQKMVDTLWK